MNKYILKLNCLKRLFVLMAMAVSLSTVFAQSTTSGSLFEPVDSDFKAHYMGNVEGGIRFPGKNYDDEAGMVAITTTHGVLIKPYLFIGAGVGAWVKYYEGYSGKSADVSMMYFVDFKGFLPLKGRFRPFVDLKFGGVEYDRLILSPTAGCKYLWGESRQRGVYLSIGSDYLFSRPAADHWGSIDGWTGFSLNLGIDF